MNRILEHVVDKVGVGLDEVIQNLENLQVLLLSLKESAECHVVAIEFNS